MGSKILVVDDELDVVKAWARTLRLAGHDVLFAQDARLALELSRANPLDLIIVDYMMPSMSGIELLNEVRKEHPHIRSIVMSGKLDSSLSEDRVLLEIRGNVSADLYLHKPVDNVRLKGAVADLLTSASEGDWKAVAENRLEAATTKTRVRAAEKVLNRRRTKKK